MQNNSLQINQIINHKIFGTGTITKIVNSTTKNPIIIIKFVNYTHTKQFTLESITPFLI